MSGRIITICLCSSRSIIDRNKVFGISDSLRKAGYTVALEPDLCEKAISSGNDMEKIASSVVMACYPRAVSALFDNLGLCPKQIVDIRNGCENDILESLGVVDGSNSIELPESSKELTEAFSPKTGCDAWFPVIDRERCNSCGKCHDFCLFGVYSKEERKVVVKNPLNCKNNCPACARVCPQKAIIFPKYDKSPINGGLKDEEFALSIDTKALYADALKAKLAERRTGVSLLKRR
jgi:MinD superfamily P-loop ATPase containing an inserted ferredoxin domain